MLVKSDESEPQTGIGTAVPILLAGIGTRLNALADRVGGKRALSHLSGVPEGSIYRYIKGESQPKLEKLVMLSRGAGVSLDWLILGERRDAACGAVPEGSAVDGSGSMDDFALVPRYNVRAAAGHGAAIEREEIVAQYAFRRDWLHRMGLQLDRLALITAQGESMEPDIRDGSMILVDMRQDQVTREGIYVLNLDGLLMAKLVQRGFNGALYIRSRHPAYREIEVPAERVAELVVIGKAVWSDRILS